MIEVRRATQADIPLLLAHRLKLWATYSDRRVEDVPGWHEAASTALHDLLPRDTHLFLVALVNEHGGAQTPVGSISARLDLGVPRLRGSGTSGTIHDTWVDDDARGQGAARALVSAAVEWCRENNCRNVHLHSTPMAVGAYEKLGFHIGVAQPGDERFPVMWKDF